MRRRGGAVTPPRCHVGEDRPTRRCAKQLLSIAAHRTAHRGEHAVTDWRTIDYFFDESLVEDPYAYYDELRSACPVPAPRPPRRGRGHRLRRSPRGLPRHRLVLVVQLGRRPLRAPSPCPLEGDDISDLIAEHRGALPMAEHMVTMDPPDHTRERALLMRLITPKRLKDNEDFMWRLADQQIDEFIGDGRCEFITGLRPALRHARGRRPARRARGGPPALPPGLRPAAAPWARSAPARRATPATTPSPGSTTEFAGLHRGPPDDAPQGRAHRPGAGHLPRRQHPRRHVGGADRRRSCSPPGRRPRPACSPPPSSTSPSTPSSRTSSGTTARRSRTSSRRCCGSRAR